MATYNKILGQLKPAPATPTVLYTVPAVTQANVNIFAANQAAVADTVRIAIVQSGNSIDNTCYIVYDLPICCRRLQTHH